MFINKDLHNNQRVTTALSPSDPTNITISAYHGLSHDSIPPLVFPGSVTWITYASLVVLMLMAVQLIYELRVWWNEGPLTFDNPARSRRSWILRILFVAANTSVVILSIVASIILYVNAHSRWYNLFLWIGVGSNMLMMTYVITTLMGCVDVDLKGLLRSKVVVEMLAIDCIEIAISFVILGAVSTSRMSELGMFLLYMYSNLLRLLVFPVIYSFLSRTIRHQERKIKLMPSTPFNSTATVYTSLTEPLD